jgi:hypothetical protein
MTKKNAPDLSSPSSPGSGSVCVGDDTIDTDCSLEAPRRPRSEAQIAAFEKARAKRAANRASAAAPEPPEPPAPAAPAAPAAPSPASAAPAAPAAKPRKARTDKGKKRGHLVRPGTANAAHEDPEDEYVPPRTGYMNFVIV